MRLPLWQFPFFPGTPGTPSVGFENYVVEGNSYKPDGQKPEHLSEREHGPLHFLRYLRRPAKRFWLDDCYIVTKRVR